jgi:putative glutamine amidotransferase
MTAVRLGVSVNFMPPDPARPIFKGKALEFVERRMAASLRRSGALPLLLPDTEDPSAAHELVAAVDGLVLSGGADVSPTSYGQSPLRPEWSGDAMRDAYERGLVEAALAAGKPVLGICRGMQLVNVALGGTLWQDISTQVDGSLVHRDWEHYDENGHALRVAPESWVGRCYLGARSLAVNSVHHQGLRDIAPGLVATAWADDGVVEAAEQIDAHRFVVGVQWHPEWLEPQRAADTGWAPGDPILRSFVEACAERRAR